MWRDVIFALRGWRRQPVILFTALLASALGIGATTAVFSFTDRILFRPLPYRDGAQLVSFGITAPVVNNGEFLFAADYKDLIAFSKPFQGITSWSGVDDCDITGPYALRQRCAEVDWSFLPVLGVELQIGRNFTADDMREGAARSVLISHAMWQSRFAARPGALQQTIEIDGAPARVIGVLPTSFELPTLQHADMLVPQIVSAAGWRHGSTRVLWPIGRMKPGLTLAAAREQMGPFFHHLISEIPTPFRKMVDTRVRSIRDRQMGAARAAAWILLAAVLGVLSIACANVANLLLAQAASRRNEFAIRAALGITRSRFARQMLTESVLLSLGGGALGVLLGYGLLRLVVSQAAGAVPHLAEARLDMRVLAFSLLLMLFSGMLFGLIPAWIAPRLEDLAATRVTGMRSSTLLKNMLVAGQVGLSIVLLSSAGLLVRSLWNLETQPLGMETSHILTAQMVLPASRYTKPEERVAFFQQVEEAMRTIPGMRAAGVSDSLPPAGWERSRPLSILQVEGSAAAAKGSNGLVVWRYVSPAYFEALRIPILRGRGFSEEDRDRGETLSILSQSLARRLFPGGDAVGQRILMPESAPMRVVGMVADVKNTALEASGDPEYYVLRGHAPDDTYLHNTGPVAQRTLSLVLRAEVPEQALTAIVRQRIGAIDASLPVEIASMKSRLGELSAGPRFHATVLLAFAWIGLLLAAVGLYGTVAYLVAQRTQEIGIRMSLGATPAAIARMMLLFSAKWTLAGAAAGVLASLWVTRWMSSLLFGVSAHDPVAFLGAVLCLIVVAFVATLQPSRKAATIDPVAALRL